MPVPYLQPTLPDPEQVGADAAAIAASGQITKGPRLAEYEAALQRRLGVGHVVATSSGTLGLTLTYKALGFDGPVIVPSFTFLATVTALSWAGATPRFVDIRPDTLTLDPSSVETAVTDDLAGIVAVPVFGVPCDVELEHIADAAGVPLVYDSAHAMGSSRAGVPLGSNGRAEVFSTTPTKTLITGEGGFVATNDAELAQRLRILVEYGNDGSYDTLTPGLNARLSEMHAAFGLRSLANLDGILERRWEIAAAYRRGLDPIEGIRFQLVPDGCIASLKDLVVLVEDGFPMSRDDLADRLASRGIETRKYFYPAVHRHRAYVDLGFTGTLPTTELVEQQTLALPLWAGMSDEQTAEVVDAIVAVAR